VTYFHPLVTLMANDGKSLIMTLQTIGGSDYFGYLQYSTSDDEGETWTEPV